MTVKRGMQANASAQVAVWVSNAQQERRVMPAGYHIVNDWQRLPDTAAPRCMRERQKDVAAEGASLARTEATGRGATRVWLEGAVADAALSRAGQSSRTSTRR